MISPILSSLALLGGCMVAMAMAGLVVVVLLQAVEDRRPEVLLALLVVALLAYYVGYRVGGV